MRRILSIAGASLVVHILLYFLLDRYRDLVFSAGRPFVHGHEISDIPEIDAVGLAVLAIPIVAGSIFIYYCIKWIWADS